MPKMGKLEEPNSPQEERISKKKNPNSGITNKKKRKIPQEEQSDKQNEDINSKPMKVSSKFGNEIDEIFSSKKKQKSPQEEQKEDSNSKPKRIKKKKGKIHEEVGFVDPPSKPRKRTGDGFVVYTEEELGIGKSDAGNTRLCPFDCSCCF